MRYFIVLFLIFAGCAETAYRLPYADGTSVTITNDHLTHSTPDLEMFDFRAAQAGSDIVAAKSGWIRFIKDSGNSASTTNNYVWIEHPLNYCQPAGAAPPGNGGLAGNCRTCPKGGRRCNEWSLYAHMQQDSVRRDAGLSEDVWVTAGQKIGVESDVGMTLCAPGDTTPLCGRHVHFAVWRFEEGSSSWVPDDNGYFQLYEDTFGIPPLLVPRFCTEAGLRYPRQGDAHVAAGCP